MISGLVLGVVALLSADSIETKPEIAQEIFVGRTVYPQGKGEPQFTFGPRWLGEEFEGASIGTIETEYGITNTWQVGVEFTRVFNKARSPLVDESAFSGAGVSIQRAWMGRKTHFALGIEGGMSGNLNDPNSYEIEPYVVVAHDVYSWMHLVGSIGSETSTPTNRGKTIFLIEKETEQTINAAAILAVKQLRFTSELTTAFSEGDRASAWTPGVIYKPAEKFEVGIARPIKIGDMGLPERFVLQLMIEL